MDYMEAIEARQSAYILDDDLTSIGITTDDIVNNVNRIAPHVPSSWNSQSIKMVILFGEDHRHLWSIVEDILRKKVNDESRFRNTKIKLDGFARAAGTILFYEDEVITDKLVEENPKYADSMYTWAEHGNAMMQFAVWVLMYEMGLGANIQHYNPIIDDRVKEDFGIPDGQRLVAQLVFGRMTGENPRSVKKQAEHIVSVGHVKR